MAQGAVSTDTRLAPALAEARKRAAARLAPKLAKANTATYLRQMRAHAKAFGQPQPKAVTDKAALAAIADRAKVSAESIVDTQASRMAALVSQYGGVGEAKPAFAEWQDGQAARLAAYEASMTTHVARAEFTDRNDLAGTEHCEPSDTAGLDDTCDDAVAMGDVPIGTLPDLPAHFNCPHFAVTTYEPPDDPSALWFGEED